MDLLFSNGNYLIKVTFLSHWVVQVLPIKKFSKKKTNTSIKGFFLSLEFQKNNSDKGTNFY